MKKVEYNNNALEKKLHIGVIGEAKTAINHIKMLEKLDAEFSLVNLSEVNNQAFDGLIIPHGLSNLCDLRLKRFVHEAFDSGLPILATGNSISLLDKDHVGIMSIRTSAASINIEGQGGLILGKIHTISSQFPMIFSKTTSGIQTDKDVEILAQVNGYTVAAKEDEVIVTSFLPEYSENTSVHEYFLQTCLRKKILNA